MESINTSSSGRGIINQDSEGILNEEEEVKKEEPCYITEEEEDNLKYFLLPHYYQDTFD